MATADNGRSENIVIPVQWSASRRADDFSVFQLSDLTNSPPCLHPPMVVLQAPISDDACGPESEFNGVNMALRSQKCNIISTLLCKSLIQ